MKNIKNIIQIPDNQLLNITRFTGEIDRFACVCHLFKIIQDKNNEYYKNITQNCNIFGKLQKILESNNEYYLKMFWTTLESYELYHENHTIEILDEKLLEMVVKYKSVEEIIRTDHFRSDFETQCKFIRLIGKYKSLDDIKALIKNDCFIMKTIDYPFFATPSTNVHYTWQYNLAIGLYESGKYDKMDYLYSNLSLNDFLSLNDLKTFPYSGFNADGSMIRSRYIKALCNWTTFQNFKHIKLNGTIIVEGNEITIPRLFRHSLNYIQIAKGLCSSKNDDTRLLKIINKKGSLSYVSLLHITIFHQNTNIMNWLTEETVKEIEYINVEIAEIKAYNANNVDTSSTMQNHLDDFLEIGKYILLAYGFATLYPEVQDFLIEKFSKNHHLLFEEEDYLKSTKKFKQIYDENI